MSRDQNTLKPGRTLARASVIMMASILLSRVMGMVREMVIAGSCGAGGEVDAYQAAFLLPDILNHVLAGGFLSVTFIPILSRYLAGNEEEAGWRTASLVLTVIGLLTAGLAVVEWLLAGDLVPLVVPGMPEALQKEAVRLTRIMIPAQIFFLSGGVLMAIQMARGRFFLPALAPLVYNAAIILGGISAGRRSGMEGFSWGVLAGAMAGNFLIQAWGAYRVGFRFRPCLKLRHPDLGEYILLTLPLALGLSMTFSTEFFFKFFGSQVSPGAIASLNYALRLMLVVVAVFGQAAGTASYPFLARLAAEGRMIEVNDLLDATLRRFLVPVIGVSVLMAVVAPEIVGLVYQRGDFTRADIPPTAAALRGFLCGAFAWAGTTIVVRGWFALKNTWIPALVSTAGVLLALPLYLLFTRWWGTCGVALGSAVSMGLQAGFLYGLWAVKTRNRGARQVLALLGRTSLLAGLLGGGALLLKQALLMGFDPAVFSGALVIVVAVSAAFTAGAFLLAPVFKIHEIADLMRRLARKPGGAGSDGQ